MERKRKNIAARAGHWSARNKKKAIFGWLAFVVLAVVIGGAAGTKTLGDNDDGSGDSVRADKIYDGAFPEATEESVLVSPRRATRARCRPASPTSAPR